MKYSIITITYNDSIGIEKAIKNVINQTYRDIEYIVIDGGPSDVSVNVIKQNDNLLAIASRRKTKVFTMS